MRGTIPGAAALGLVVTCLLAGCGDQGGLSSTSGDTPAENRPATFDERRVTWAQGRTLHYGEDTFRLPGRADGGLWRTPYGFVVAVKETTEPGGGTLTWFDGRTATPLAGDPVGVHVSPDGRYAGWIDYDGPKRPVGRLAEVVVVDLSTGAEVLRNHDDMGGAGDDLDNLYEDAGLGFRGFDDDYVYWETAEGSPTSKRARIGEWEVEPDPAADPNGPPPPPLAYDTLSGLSSGLDDDGTLSETGEGLDGLASPEGRWCVTTGEPGPLPVVDCRTARRVTPDYPARMNFFAGWTGPSTYAVVSADREVLPVDGGGGPTPGQISECTLPSGACRPLVQLADVRTVVVGIGDNSQLGG